MEKMCIILMMIVVSAKYAHGEPIEYFDELNTKGESMIQKLTALEYLDQMAQDEIEPDEEYYLRLARTVMYYLRLEKTLVDMSDDKISKESY